MCHVVTQALFYPLRVFLLALRDALARLHSEMRQRQQLLQQAQQAAQVGKGGEGRGAHGHTQIVSVITQTW